MVTTKNKSKPNKQNKAKTMKTSNGKTKNYAHPIKNGELTQVLIVGAGVKQFIVLIQPNI